MSNSHAQNRAWRYSYLISLAFRWKFGLHYDIRRIKLYWKNIIWAKLNVGISRTKRKRHVKFTICLRKFFSSTFRCGGCHGVSQIFIWRPGIRRSYPSKFSYEHEKLTCHKICHYVAWNGFKVSVFEQFRHALTRHDPKTYLPWLVELILLKLKE